jgi:hypothetical protein
MRKRKGSASRQKGMVPKERKKVIGPLYPEEFAAGDEVAQGKNPRRWAIPILDRTSATQMRQVHSLSTIGVRSRRRDRFVENESGRLEAWVPNATKREKAMLVST